MFVIKRNNVKRRRKIVFTDKWKQPGAVHLPLAFNVFLRVLLVVIEKEKAKRYHLPIEQLAIGALLRRFANQKFKSKSKNQSNSSLMHILIGLAFNDLSVNNHHMAQIFKAYGYHDRITTFFKELAFNNPINGSMSSR